MNSDNFRRILKTKAYDTYWKFAYERQEIFYRRLKGERDCLTNDSVFKEYKFTNTYRICDRVSQYLVREVIYSDNYGVEDTFLRIILFKLFNKIETWQLLQYRLGEVCKENFDVELIGSFLDSEMNKGRVLYSNAYMMASGSKEFNVKRKHKAHLLLLKKMLNDGLPRKIEQSKSMEQAYNLLVDYPLIGKFLAYQYVTDINYSEIVDFSESEFTVPGPGARDGIKKCIPSLGKYSERDVIKLMAERQEYEFERLGLNFRYLGGRKLQYIDIQNIFCETDKYCRVVHPEILGLSKRTRIKQKFKRNDTSIKFFFPPKWKLNMDK